MNEKQKTVTQNSEDKMADDNYPKRLEAQLAELRAQLELAQTDNEKLTKERNKLAGELKNATSAKRTSASKALKQIQFKGQKFIFNEDAFEKLFHNMARNFNHMPTSQLTNQYLAEILSLDHPEEARKLLE